MKFSMLEKPAPTWKVPVGRSLTSMLTFILSGAEPCSVRDVDALEVAERGDARLRDSSSFVSLKSSPSLISISRRITLSRVLRVAADLDALEVARAGRARSARSMSTSRCSGSSSVCGLGLDVGVAVVAVQRADRLQVLRAARRG